MHKFKVIGGSILSTLWETEKSDWRLSFRIGLVLGLIIGVLSAVACYYLFGTWVAVLGFLGGTVIGTLICMLGIYFIVATTSIFD